MKKFVLLLSVFSMLTFVSCGPEFMKLLGLGTEDSTASPAPLSGNTYSFQDISNGAAVNGVHAGIDFGTGVWSAFDCTLQINGGFTTGKSASFVNNTIAPAGESFTLPEGAYLTSIEVGCSSTFGKTYTAEDTTYEISDGVNPPITGFFEGGPLNADTPGFTRLVTTGWTSGGRTITIKFSRGNDGGIANIAFFSATEVESPVPVIDPSPTPTPVESVDPGVSPTPSPSPKTSPVPIGVAYSLDLTADYNGKTVGAITFPVAQEVNGWTANASGNAGLSVTNLGFANNKVYNSAKPSWGGPQTRGTFTLPTGAHLVSLDLGFQYNDECNYIIKCGNSAGQTISGKITANATEKDAGKVTTITTNFTTGKNITVTLDIGWDAAIGNIVYAMSDNVPVNYTIDETADYNGKTVGGITFPAVVQYSSGWGVNDVGNAALPVINLGFAANPADLKSASFTLPSGVALQSLDIGFQYNDSCTYKLHDGVNPDVEGTITLGSSTQDVGVYKTIKTGWTQPGPDVTVSLSVGWDAAIGNIVYGAAPQEARNVLSVHNAVADTDSTVTTLPNGPYATDTVTVEFDYITGVVGSALDNTFIGFASSAYDLSQKDKKKCGIGILSAGYTFNSSPKKWNIIARNDSAYEFVNEILCKPSTTYHFKVVANLVNHTYSVWVTPSDSTETIVATDYVFRGGYTPAATSHDDLKYLVFLCDGSSANDSTLANVTVK